MMEFNDAARAMQALGSTEAHESLRESLVRLSYSIQGPSMDIRMVSIDDLFLPNLHPSRIGDPPARGCDAAPNRKPKPWESVQWQPRRKR